LLGLILFLLEIKVTSYGALTIGGVVALLLGSVLLFDADNPFGSVPITVILPAVLFSVVFFLFIIGLGLAAQRRRPFSGREAMAGQVGEVVKAEGQRGDFFRGRVQIAGELWEYQAQQELQPGESVRVVSCRGRTVIIEALPRGEERRGL
jgi:membrane-bound serine protease (ClpP class)